MLGLDGFARLAERTGRRVAAAALAGWRAIGDIGDRDLADYFRGQVMPVSETRTKEMPEWFVSFISRKLKQTAARRPGRGDEGASGGQNC